MFDRSKRSLPGLPPGDPRLLLSSDARIRLEEALDAADSIWESAHAQIWASWKAECNPEIGFHEYMATGAAFVEISAATREAAYVSLAAEVREFMAIGITGAKLTNIMRERMDAVATERVGLTVIEQNAVLARLRTIQPAGPALVERPADPGGRPAGTLTNGAAIRELRREAELNQESLAASCGVSVNTLQRAEAGGPVSEEKLALIADGLAKELAKKELGRDIPPDSLKKITAITPKT